MTSTSVPLRVVYVAGWGRSGTTIIGNTLNEAAGFFHIGELIRVWEIGVMSNRQCGSGVPFRESSVWKAIFDEAFGGFNGVRPQEVVRWRKQGPGNLDVIRARATGKQLELNPDYLQVLERLYHSIAKVTGCTHIIDTSKNPSHGYVLGHISSIDMSVLHVVRDARATAYSWQKNVLREDFADNPRKMKKFSATQNSAYWMRNNIAAELVGTMDRCDYHRLLYEDFARRPRACVSDVLHHLGAPPDLSMFASENEVRLGTNHTVWGNPNRSKSGLITIKADDTWKTSLDVKSRLLTTSLTWPLLLRYGYLSGRSNGTS